MRSGFGLLLGALIVTAAPAVIARADVTDDAFVVALERSGMTVTNRDAAIAAGHMVCVAFDQGSTPSAVVTSLMGQGFSPHDAGSIMGISVAAYCPKYRSAVESNSWVAGLT
ncbi:DUF732 domain-containing protein [Mycobacterium palustre]|uniref:DUF732 domain-containing protein n=1 Tax=Mycobacterium palustre TaxID=153971 RepID=UPI00130257A7|nr:DUF732 domain-containing protein [Mycobacterium palustre]MCV7101544.1 DUF732 domain-containing protein [Mycobacterium palustre]